MNDVRTTLLHLSLIDGVGPATIQKILSVLSPTPDALSCLYTLPASQYVSLFHITPTLAQKLVAGLANRALLEQELAYMDTYNIQVTTIADDEYPSLLRHIYLPPPVIYWQGSWVLTTDAKAVAVVGSRKANYYGQRVIQQLIPPLVAQNAVIVSGGAVGADTMAHRAALDAGGKTVVVLGSGLLRPYPRSNISLFNGIQARGGMLMSIFPLTAEPLPGNFPARNRVISGVSHGCIVVQAAAESGAAITAFCALEQGRDVFAVPGPIDDELSAGCHALIKEGATLLDNPKEVLAWCRPLADAKVERVTVSAVESPAKLAVNEPSPVLSDPVLEACRRPQSIDELLQCTGTPLSVLQERLFTLQLQGLIEQDFMGLWITR